MTTTYTTRATINADHTITISVPEDMPVGEAEVTVCVGEEEAGTPAGRRLSRGWSGKELLAWLDSERRQHPRTWTPRTREEVDADLDAMRDEWDR